MKCVNGAEKLISKRRSSQDAAKLADQKILKMLVRIFGRTAAVEGIRLNKQPIETNRNCLSDFGEKFFDKKG